MFAVRLFAALLLSVLASSLYADAAIYRCEQDGVTIFADRPCSEAAQPYVAARPLNTFEAPPIEPSKRTSRPVQKRALAARAGSVDAARRVEDCARIAAGLKDIRSRMRAGYRAAEGERLRARQAKLQERRKAQRCK